MKLLANKHMVTASHAPDNTFDCFSNTAFLKWPLYRLDELAGLVQRAMHGGTLLEIIYIAENAKRFQQTFAKGAAITPHAPQTATRIFHIDEDASLLRFPSDTSNAAGFHRLISNRNAWSHILVL